MILSHTAIKSDFRQYFRKMKARSASLFNQLTALEGVTIVRIAHGGPADRFDQAPILGMVCTYTRTHAHARARTHARTHTRTHTHTHAHTHTRTHTRTHTHPLGRWDPWLLPLPLMGAWVGGGWVCAWVGVCGCVCARARVCVDGGGFRRFPRQALDDCIHTHEPHTHTHTHTHRHMRAHARARTQGIQG